MTNTKTINLHNDVVFNGSALRRNGQNPEGSTSSAIFTVDPHCPLVERSDIHETSEKDHLFKHDLSDHDLGLLSSKQLREQWPSEYQSWKAMRYNRTGKNGNYIRHSSFDTFPHFLAVLGPKPHPTYTLDRIDYNNPEYSPDNCRWASKALQVANRSNTRLLTDNNGLCVTVAEWSKRGPTVKIKTILNRIDNLGWSEHDAVHLPTGQRPKAARSTACVPLNADKYVSIFVRIMKDEHGDSFVPITAADRKMLKEIAGHLIKGGLNEVEALECVLENWWEFTDYAEYVYGAFKPPANPTIKYMVRALPGIGNFYVDKRQTNKRSPAEEFEAFQREFFMRDPEVHHYMLAIKAHQNGKNEPDCGFRKNGWNIFVDPDSGAFVQLEGGPTPVELWALRGMALEGQLEFSIEEHNLREKVLEAWQHKQKDCS